MRQLCNLLFCADHQSYAWYLPILFAQLIAHLFRTNSSSVLRSKVPEFRNAIDITIEQTIIRSAKTIEGLVGFSRNPSVGASHDIHELPMFSQHLKLLVWLLKPMTCIKLIVFLKFIAAIWPWRKMMAFQQFSNPFSSSLHQSSELFCLSSGKPASKKRSSFMTPWNDWIWKFSRL